MAEKRATTTGKKSRWRTVGRWALRGLLGLVLLVVGLYVYSAIAVAHAGDRRYDVPRAHLVIPTDPASIEHGRHLATTIVGCTTCHGSDLGGSVRDDIPMMVLVAAPNLTRGQGGVGARYSVEDWERAVRHGVRRDGSPIVFMPAKTMNSLSDEDTAAIIAWVRSVPPVDRAPLRTKLRPMGTILGALGVFPLFEAAEIDHHARRSPPGTDPVGRGAYLIDVGGCRGCHGEHLSGGPIPGAPPSLPVPLNLTAHATGLGPYAEADFVRAVREGRRKNGQALDEFMPWKSYGGMTDEELHEMWLYLHTLPPRAFGGR